MRISDWSSDVCSSDLYPRITAYVLDDQRRVRKHIAIFVDDVMQPRETALATLLDDDSEVYVMQALSGGEGKEKWTCRTVSSPRPARACSNCGARDRATGTSPAPPSWDRRSACGWTIRGTELLFPGWTWGRWA